MCWLVVGGASEMVFPFLHKKIDTTAIVSIWNIFFLTTDELHQQHKDMKKLLIKKATPEGAASRY